MYFCQGKPESHKIALWYTSYWAKLLGWHVVIVTGKQLGAFIIHAISNTLRSFNRAVCLNCFYLPVADTPFVWIRALDKVQCTVGAPQIDRTIKGLNWKNYSYSVHVTCFYSSTRLINSPWLWCLYQGWLLKSIYYTSTINNNIIILFIIVFDVQFACEFALFMFHVKKYYWEEHTILLWSYLVSKRHDYWF